MQLKKSRELSKAPKKQVLFWEEAKKQVVLGGSISVGKDAVSNSQ